MSVMLRLKPTAFISGGPFAGKPAHMVRYIMQSGVESAPHIAHKTWINGRDPGNPQPPNSISIVMHGKQPSWFETPLEFNLLPYSEIRAQIANEIERGVMEVISTAGTATATGLILTSAQASLVDGEIVALITAAGVPINFHFDVSGSYTPGGGYGAGDIRVNVSGDTTSIDVAATLAAAINGTAFTASAPALTNVVNVTQTTTGPSGNTSMSSTVATADFEIAGFGGGGAATAAQVRTLPTGTVP